MLIRGAQPNRRHIAVILGALANIFIGKAERIGKGLGMKIKTVITDGSQPIGNGIGPVLEARDVLYVLMNSPIAPMDLRKRSLFLAEEMLAMAGKPRSLAGKMLDSGAAYKKMVEIIREQGEKCTLPGLLKPGKFKYNFVAKKSGHISHIDNASISKIARIAGAPKDKGAGIYLHKHRMDKVKKGEKILTIYAENRQELNFAAEAMREFDGVEIK